MTYPPSIGVYVSKGHRNLAFIVYTYRSALSVSIGSECGSEICYSVLIGYLDSLRHLRSCRRERRKRKASH